MRFHSLIASYLYDFGIQFEFHHLNNKRCVIFFPSFDFFSSAAAADVTVAAIGIAGDSYVRAFFFWNRFIYLNGIRFEQIKRKNCQFHMYPV